MLCYHIKPFTTLPQIDIIFIAVLNLITRHYHKPSNFQFQNGTYFLLYKLLSPPRPPLSLFAFAPGIRFQMDPTSRLNSSLLLVLPFSRSFLFFWGACRPYSVPLMFVCRATWPPFMFRITHDFHQPSLISDPYRVFLNTTTSLGPLITGLCFQSTIELRIAKPDEIELTKAYKREAWSHCTVHVWHRNKTQHPNVSS